MLGYAAKLRSLGKDFSLLVNPDAGHSIDDPLAVEAHQYLLELMLHEHLGGAAPSPRDRELREFLKRNLRIAGRELREVGLEATR